MGPQKWGQLGIPTGPRGSRRSASTVDPLTKHKLDQIASHRGLSTIFLISDSRLFFSRAAFFAISRSCGVRICSSCLSDIDRSIERSILPIVCVFVLDKVHKNPSNNTVTAVAERCQIFFDSIVIPGFQKNVYKLCKSKSI